MGCLMCLRCDKVMKWRTNHKKRVLCEEEENSGRTPQTSSVSAWSHINEASVWILSYSESLRHWFLLSRLRITTTTSLNQEVKALFFTLNMALSCRCVTNRCLFSSILLQVEVTLKKCRVSDQEWSVACWSRWHGYKWKTQLLTFCIDVPILAGDVICAEH